MARRLYKVEYFECTTLKKKTITVIAACEIDAEDIVTYNLRLGTPTTKTERVNGRNNNG